MATAIRTNCNVDLLADHSIGGAPGSATGYANGSGNDRVVLILSIMLITFVNSWQLHMSAMTTIHPQRHVKRSGMYQSELWVTGFSFFHCVASPFHSFVTTFTGATAPGAQLRKRSSRRRRVHN